MNSSPKRGDIVRIRFDPTEESEQAGDRPALVISPDLINYRAPIVLVAPLTTRKTENVYPFEAIIEASDGGISQRSKVMLLHLRGVDKTRIIGSYGTVSEATMVHVEAALKIATGITKV